MKSKAHQKLFNDLKNLISRIQSTAEVEDTTSRGSLSTSTMEPVQLQPPTFDNDFLDKILEKLEEFQDKSSSTFNKSEFYDILRSTSRIVLSGNWFKVDSIDKDKKNDLKEKITSFDFHHFPSLPMDEIKYFRKLLDYQVLLMDSPQEIWPQKICDMMDDYKNIDYTKALYFWQLEGPIVIETRIENMLKAKEFYNKALALVKIGILMGQKNALHNQNSIQQPEDQQQQHDQQPESDIPYSYGSELSSILSWTFSHNENLYHKYQDLFFILLILQENYQELDEWLLPEIAMEWSYRLFTLQTPEGQSQIAPYWNGWRKIDKIKNGVIIMAMRTTWRILRNKLFTTTEGLKHMFALVYVLTEPDARPKPVSQLNTEIFASIRKIPEIDHVYALVEYIIENEVEKKYLAERNKLFLDLLIRALTEEINRIRTAELLTDTSKSLVQSMETHLSLRYRMASDYLQSYPILSWEFLLTAFSLHPTLHLKNKLFNNNLVIKSYRENMNIISKELECMNLSQELMEDVYSIIKGRRIESLSFFENSRVLRQKCEEHIHLKGYQFIEKGHLRNLKIDFSKYNSDEYPPLIEKLEYEEGFKPTDKRFHRKMPKLEKFDECDAKTELVPVQKVKKTYKKLGKNEKQGKGKVKPKPKRPSIKKAKLKKKKLDVKVKRKVGRQKKIDDLEDPVNYKRIQPKRKSTRTMKNDQGVKKLKLDNDDNTIIISGLHKVPKNYFRKITSTSKAVENNSQNVIEKIINNLPNSPTPDVIFENIQSESPISSLDNTQPAFSTCTTTIISPMILQNIVEIEDICPGNMTRQKIGEESLIEKNQNVDKKGETTEISPMNIEKNGEESLIENPNVDEKEETKEISPIAIEKNGNEESLFENEFRVEVEVEVESSLVGDSNQNCDINGENMDNLNQNCDEGDEGEAMDYSSDSDSSSSTSIISCHSDRTTLVDSDSDQEQGKGYSIRQQESDDFDSSSDSEFEQDSDCEMVYEAPPPDDDVMCNLPNIFIKKEVEDTVVQVSPQTLTNNGSSAKSIQNLLIPPPVIKVEKTEETINNENVLPPSDITSLTAPLLPNSQSKLQEEISVGSETTCKIISLKELIVILKPIPLKKNHLGFQLYS